MFVSQFALGLLTSQTGRNPRSAALRGRRLKSVKRFMAESINSLAILKQFRLILEGIFVYFLALTY